MDGDNRYYPLTNPQKGIWYTEKLYPGTSICNIAATLRIKGKVDFYRLEKAINIFIEKNEAVRFRVIETDSGPKQYVTPYKYTKFEFFDFSGKSIEELYKWDEEQTRQPFESLDGCLYYIALIKINENDGGFFAKTHHIISDAWSMIMLGNEIVEYYCALKNKKEINHLKKQSYFDYVLKEPEYKSSQRFVKDMQFWNDVLCDFSEVTMLKNRKSNTPTIKAKRKTFLLPQKLSNKIQNYCTEKGLSEYALFFAALSMYINRVSGKEEMILGTTLLNRTSAAEKDTFGMFANTAIPVKIHIKDDMNLKTYVEYISKEILTVLRHQKYPYDLMLKEVKKSGKSSEALFDIVLNYQNSKIKKDFDEQFFSRWHFNGYQIESLIINVNDRDDNGYLIIDYDYLVDVFNATEIEFIHQHLINLLWHALDDTEKKISNLEMLSEKEKNKILYKFNDTNADFPDNKTIHQMFEEQVEKTPDSVAVIFGDRHITYRELNERSNMLARLLRKKGIGPEKIVGILSYRSFEMMVGIMGILKAGGAYLPIDPEYPEERIRYMLDDSNARVLLTQRRLAYKFDSDIDVIVLEDEMIYSGDVSNPEHINFPTNLAYIIYTSGSTNKPKGVMIEHRSLVNRLNWMQKRYPLSKESVILQKTSYTFDVSVWELLWWSITGAKVCLLVPGGEKDPEAIVSAIANHKITTIHFVPSMLNIFLDFLEERGDVSGLKSLKQMFASGEALKIQHVVKFNKLLNEANGTKLYNLYGPTEATIDVSYFDCTPDTNLNTVPIGRPIDNTKLFILDRNKNILPIGIQGELYIGGVGVARGYLNNTRLTSEKFIDSPFDNGERLYRTGDYARWYPMGDIEYLGRIDSQVKIRGFRIELGEIESALLAHEDVAAAVVVGKTDSGDNKYLCAYLVCKNEVNISEIKRHLSDKLPIYMIPSFFIFLQELPLLSNGKINFKALPEPHSVTNEDTEYTAPCNETEEALAEIISVILKKKRIGMDDILSDLGLDSLAIIDIMIRINKFEWDLSVEDFYRYKTIREISNKVRGTAQDNPEPKTTATGTIETIEEISCTIDDAITTQNILLTGATGFLGLHLLCELMDETDSTVYCLVRGNRESTSADRMKELLYFYRKGQYTNQLGKRIHIVNGDVSLERMGLSENEYMGLGEKIDTVIHSAALVKYYGEYSQIEKVNVFGTKQIIDFCLKFRARLNHISTVSITGNYLVDNDIQNVSFSENDFYIGQNYSGNIYVNSKFESENLVYKAMKSGLTASVYRMGNLTGRYADGHFQKNINDNAFYNAFRSIVLSEAVHAGLLDEEIEFTPVDFASRAIVKLMMTESYNRVFHIFNNKTKKIREIIDILNEISNRKIRILDMHGMNRHLNTLSKDPSMKTVLSNMVIYLNQKGELSHTVSIQIESKSTGNLLKELGFEWPDIQKDYIRSLMEYMKRTEYLNA